MNYEAIITLVKLARAAEENINVHENDTDPGMTIYRLKQVKEKLEEAERKMDREIHRVAMRIAGIDDEI